MINEDQLEQLCISWFKETGYQTITGKQISPEGKTPERGNYRQVILKERLVSQLKIINPDIPPHLIEDAAKRIAILETQVLTKNNHIFHKFMIEGLSVEFNEKKENKTEYIKLIDFDIIENNQFLVVDQFTVSGTKHFRRPDLIVFINGLPIAVIELKNPADENADIWDAYNQLQTYKEEILDLFVFNEALIISDGLTARVGSLSASKEWFMPWRTIKNENDKPDLEYELEKLVKGFFDKELLLDYLRYFILFEQDNDTIIKKIAGYHQFHAVRQAVHATIIAAKESGKDEIQETRATWGNKVEEGSRKAGIVWHTQGSGKSISMVCYASKLLTSPEMKSPTLVVVTDRNNLDGQLFNTFKMARENLKQRPVQAQDRDNLRDILSSRTSGGIVFSTVQKFALMTGEDNHPVLSKRNNIVVISDEAHRSQYGDKAKLNKKTGQYTFGYSKHLRDALPGATFIGFTGTPLSLEDKDTRAVFGDYVSIYDIQDAVDDGATVPIYYESRLAKLDINKEEIEDLNKDVEEVFEDEEDLIEREKVKSKWATLEKLVGSGPRIDQVAKDLVDHFTSRTDSFPGKAIIVHEPGNLCQYV